MKEQNIKTHTIIKCGETVFTITMLLYTVDYITILSSLRSNEKSPVSARQHLEDEIEHVRELLADLYLGSLWMVGHLCERVTGEAEAAEHRADQHDVRVESAHVGGVGCKMNVNNNNNNSSESKTF